MDDHHFFFSSALDVSITFTYEESCVEVRGVPDNLIDLLMDEISGRVYSRG